MTLIDYLYEHKLTPYALSLAAGVSHPTVYRLLAGSHRPSMATMQAISEATGGAVSTLEDFVMKKSKASVSYTDKSAEYRRKNLPFVSLYDPRLYDPNDKFPYDQEVVEKVDPAERCSLCRHWRAPAGCTLVEGRIAAAGWCRLFQR